MEEEIGEKKVIPLTPHELCLLVILTKKEGCRERPMVGSSHPKSTQLYFLSFQDILPKKEGCSERPVVWSPDTNIILLTRASLSLTTTYVSVWWACVEYDLQTLLPDSVSPAGQPL
jgi:hypothetical protein